VLLGAIHGSGAFRHFRGAVERLGLLDAWYRYREEAIQQIARPCLLRDRACSYQWEAATQ
jgi:hypothetical protein